MLRAFLLAFVVLCAVAACGGSDSPIAEKQPDPTPMVETTKAALQLRLENHAPWTYAKSGLFNTPVGRGMPGPIRSGDAYEITFTAGKQHRLSFVTMLGASNDWFYGTGPEGVALYADGAPISADISDQLHLYDSGTEVDEEPGVGASTGPKQPDPAAGAPDPIARVRELINPITLSDGSRFEAPLPAQALRVTIAPTGVARELKLRIENISGADTLMTSEGPKPLGCSPGVWVLHSAPNPLFTLDSADRGLGLELIAESGRAQMLADHAAASSGVATGFSPMFYAIHDASAKPFYALGEIDRGQGLEAIAESGNVMMLSEEFTRALPAGVKAFGVVNMPEGSSDPGPVRPGQTYRLSIEVEAGDRLSLVSMYGASNDWLVATPEDGIALFDSSDKPQLGDVTDQLRFLDAGSELDEEPGVGAHTGPNQVSPDSGELDPMRNVRIVGRDRYARNVGEHLRLEIDSDEAQP